MVNRFNLKGILSRNMSRVARLAKPFAHHLSPFTFHHSPSTRFSPFIFHLSPRSGFTLIEILVASLLLGMLMTILTMVFNSSAIAWRTGKASNSRMSLARRQLAYVQKLADNALPRINPVSRSDTGYILGPWDKKGDLRKRGVEVLPSDIPFNLPSWGSQASFNGGTTAPVTPWVKVTNIQSLQTDSGRSYLVGVRSQGPDKNDAGDDIDTMPVMIE